MKRKATKIVELVIADDSEELTIDAISLVTSPAIEQDFVFFGKENNNLTLAKVDEEKRMLVSPALIPNKQIFRYDPNTDSNYYVFFSKETVRKSSELYLEHNNHHKATYQHEERVSGVLTVESWIIEDTKKDKSTLYGFSLPVGTWMVKLRIDNDEMWNKIKDGELKGLSIEGYFINKMEKMGKQQFSNEEIREAIKELLSKKKIKKIELATIGSVRGKYTKLIKKYSNWISEIAKRSNEGTRFSGDIFNIVGDLEKLKTQAKELGIDKVVNELNNDIQVAMSVREKAQTAGDILGKLLKLKP